MVSLHEPVGRSSALKLETIRELDTTHLSEAAAQGAVVVHVREAMQKLGLTYCQPFYALGLRLG
jgi:predicted glutamine amidotransferase